MFVRSNFLYKYMQAEHARNFVEKGEMLIGTLVDYRNEEKYGTAIGDSTENQTIVWGNPKVLSSESSAGWNPLTESFAGSIRNGSNIRMVDCLFTQTLSSGDRWIYSVSRVLSKRIAREFKADTCVRIKEPKEFLQALWNALRPQRHATHPTFAPCEYLDKRVHWSDYNGVPPERQKRQELEYQAEMRAIYRSSQTHIGPICHPRTRSYAVHRNCAHSWVEGAFCRRRRAHAA